MWRSAVLVSALCLACSGEDSSVAHPPAQDSLARQLAWLPSTTQSVSRLPAAMLLDSLAEVAGSKPECWRRIEAGIRGFYLLDTRQGPSTSASAGSNHFAFRGSWQRADVEACVRTAFPPNHALHAAIVSDGDVTRIETPAGSAFLWWRGHGWVIVGSEAEIAAARKYDGSLAANRCLVPLLEQLPDRDLAVASCQPIVDNLLGVPTRGFIVVASGVPNQRADGRVTAFYASAADAGRAAAAWKSGSFSDRLPQPIRAFLARLPVSVDRDRMHVDFHFDKSDFDTLATMDIGALQQKLASPPDRP
jgi:hypothetical protein